MANCRIPLSVFDKSGPSKNGGITPNKESNHVR